MKFKIKEGNWKQKNKNQIKLAIERRKKETEKRQDNDATNALHLLVLFTPLYTFFIFIKDLKSYCSGIEMNSSFCHCIL